MADSAYSKPEIQSWGSVTDLTQVGMTNPGNDAMCGSVNPPGLPDQCNP